MAQSHATVAGWNTGAVWLARSGSCATTLPDPRRQLLVAQPAVAIGRVGGSPSAEVAQLRGGNDLGEGGPGRLGEAQPRDQLAARRGDRQLDGELPPQRLQAGEEKRVDRSAVLPEGGEPIAFGQATQRNRARLGRLGS